MDGVKSILENVKNGNISVDEALLKLKIEPFEDLGFAKIDHHRLLRQGIGDSFNYKNEQRGKRVCTGQNAF